MDNLTHSLIGVCLSRAGLNRLASDVTPILVIAANIPDVDVVTWFGGPATLLEWHRSYTHSLAFSPLLALLSVALIRIFSRKRTGWFAAWAIAELGVLSHLLLDLTNNYGVRILEPFSPRWFDWDITFVVDPYIWVALLLALFAPFLGRLLVSELGAPRRKYPSIAGPVLGLAFVLFYDGARALLHARATATLDSRLYQQEAPIRVAAFPTPLSPLAWQGLVETSDRYLSYQLDLAAIFDPAAARVFYKNDPTPALAALQRLNDFGVLIGFAQYPLWRAITDESNARYRLTDLRFGDPVAQTFTCSARLVDARTAADERCDFTFSARFGNE